MKSKLLFTFYFLLITFFTNAQQPEKLNATEIYGKIQKLNFLGSVLYLAAHPDDENTKLIAYFSNHYHANTAYLSLTRGDGGQNLIGTELREKLGAIRTQELLAARRIDGGTQFFTRANDFGYSKQPNETFTIWNKKEVLDDVIQVINNFQPDIIINRFDHRTPGSTHGHHTASAILSLEANDLVKIKTKRIFFNTSWWFYGSQEKFKNADKSKLFSVDANVYYPLIGKSNHEIAALSRSQHQCQGFGTIGTRGDDLEYLELIKGTMPPKDNFFEGIDTSWKRVKGGEEIEKILQPIEANFNFKNPSVHIPELVKAYQLIQKLDDEHWKKIKSKEIKQIIESCAGLYLEAVASTEMATPNSTIEIAIEAINRSNTNIKLKAVNLLDEETILTNKTLRNNEKYSYTTEFKIPNSMPYSNLFWLEKTPQNGMYQVDDIALRNLPERNNPYPVEFKLSIDGQNFSFIKNLVFKENKPDFGETYSPFCIVPKFTTEIVNPISIFNANQSQKIEVKITSFEANSSGNVTLQLPKNWKVEPSEIPVSISAKGESKSVVFTVTAPEKAETSVVKAVVTSNGQTFNKKITQIDYKHIPKQTILENSEAKFVNLNIKTSAKNIGYVMGAGDEVGKFLQNLHYNITELKTEDLVAENLQKFDAVILGIRAFNVLDDLKFKNKILFNYVENGGNLIVQYNTNRGLLTEEIAPYSLELSRDRVTDENSEVQFINPNHSALNYPNKITQNDFNGWVQERGLYFPNKWSSEFIPILAMHDQGEDSLQGSLLIAKYGKGNYVYTGLSFFRELPEGVSGAYKLLVNLIELE